MFLETPCISIKIYIYIQIIDGNPEVQKISKLARVRGVFSGNPLYAAYGNRDSDIMAYKALSIPEDHIFR